MPGFSRSLAELAELAGDALDARATQVLLRTFSELHQELADQVTKAEFRELTAVVQELAEAQKRTEQRVEELAQAQKRTEQRVEELAQAQKRTEQRVEELAQAQKRTEQRVEELAQAQKRTEQRVEELAEAQKRTEQRVEELAEAQKRTEQRVEELAQAQKRTEQRMEELAQAQKRTEQRVEELAQAQKQTEKEIRSLAAALKETRTMVGGLSDAVGYTLEDRAIRSLPELLPELAGVRPEGPFARSWVSDRNGELVELNILGYGRRASGEAVTVVGEAKARARVKDVDDLRRLLERLSDTAVVRGQLLGVLVSYQLRPEVEERARHAGVVVVPSYRLAS